MKRYFLFCIFSLIGGFAISQNEVTLKSKSDTAVIGLLDSTFFIKIDGKEYLKIPKGKTVFLSGATGAWEDVRVPVNATTASGSNPPEFSSFKNSGGKFNGSALNFDGINDYDSIPANKLLNFQQSSFTISFWIQYDSDINEDAKILYKKDGWNFAIVHDKLRVYFEGEQIFYSTIDLNDGARNFVVISVVNNNSSFKLNLQINGKPAGAQSYYSSIKDLTAPVFIGKPQSVGFGKNFKGKLDELNFWNKLLTMEERDSLWNNSKGTNKIIAKQNHILGYSFDDNNNKFLTANSKNNVNAFSQSSVTSPSYTTGLISETIISHGVFAYYFEKNLNEELFFNAQLPHGWMEGTDIEPHVHYLRPSNDTGTVVWGLEYTWTNIGEEFPITKTIYTYDNKMEPLSQHIYKSFGFLKGEGKKISSMLMCRIFRDAENPLDTYNSDAGLIEIDFHIRNNTIGSSGILK